jgi:hypothetical protein
LEGDLDRVRVLERIDPDRLSDDDRVRLHVQLSRQQLLAGRIDDGKRHARLATEAATTVDQRAETWLARRRADGIGLPITHDDPAPSTEGLTSPELRLLIGQELVIDTIVTGGSRSRWESLVEHAELADSHPYPTSAWFSKMFLATALCDQGRLSETKKAAQRARTFGQKSAVRVADGTFLTQFFVWEMLGRRHGALYPELTAGGPADVTANVIFPTAVASCHVAYANRVGVGALSTDQAAEERARAHERVRAVCGQLAASHLGPGAVGAMADAIADTGDIELMAWARKLLEARPGPYLVLASAAANLGPAQRLLAKLEPDRNNAADLLAAAVGQADADELALWQVLCRLELAEHLGRDHTDWRRLIDQAETWATTRWLNRLIAERVRSSEPR